MHTGGSRTVAIRLASLACAAGLIALSVATATPPVESVEHLDMQRYAGIWYELARMPNRLQARCVADATTSYRQLDDGSMSLVQRCREEGNRWGVMVGRAMHIAGDRSGARLKLSFLPPWLAWWPSSTEDHWIVMLDEDYRYAVVSQPSRRGLWILSRTPTLDPDTYESIVARLRAQRYPVDQLVPTPQRLQHEPRAYAQAPRLVV